MDCFNPCLTQSCRERSFLQHLVRACAAPNSSRGKIHTATVDRNYCLEYAQSSTVLSDKMEGEKVFTCDRCKYKTIYSWNLKRHILNIHENSPRRATIYNCSEGEGCKYQTSRKKNLTRHITARHKKKKLRKCKYCEYSTTSLAYYKRHEESHAAGALTKHSCNVCKIGFHSNKDFESHLDDVHPKEDSFNIINSAFEKRLRVYQKNIRKKGVDITFLWETFHEFKSLCKRILAEDFPAFRLNVVVFGVFTKLSSDELEEETEVFALKTSHFVIKSNTKLKNIWTSVIRNLDDRLDNLLMHGSGWSLTEVLKVNLEISKIEPLRYNCVEPKYRPDLALRNIRGRKYLTNIANSKWNCFLTCLAYHYLSKKMKGIEDVSKNEYYYRQFISQINFDGSGIDYPYNKPVTISQMKRLLKNNKKMFGDLQVNILSMIDETIHGHQTGIGAKETENVLNLLSVPLNDMTDENNKKYQEHLIVINNITKFLTKKTSNRSYNERRYLCFKCLNFCSSKQNLKKHKLMCNNPRGQAEFAPEPGESVKFKNWNRKYTTPVIGFLDFETCQVDSKDNPDVKDMKAYQYSLIFVDQNMDLIYEERKFSSDGQAGQLAIDSLLNIEERLFKKVKRSLPMKVSKQERVKLRKATHCHICEKRFKKKEDEEPCIDHDHYDGKILG